MTGALLAACGGFVASGDAAEERGALPSGGQSEPATTESGAKSAEEVAKELANPNNSLASLTFKNQFRWYAGNLPSNHDICRAGRSLDRFCHRAFRDVYECGIGKRFFRKEQ